MAKIEKPVAVQNFASILAASDAIMIARGDLGVELPVQKLPSLQKKLLSLCRDACKPVLVATQMLESMVTNPVPTRVEVNDVATAIYDGADAIMLSAETVAGRYPVNTVTTMVDVASEVEEDAALRGPASGYLPLGRKADPLAAAALEGSQRPARSQPSAALHGPAPPPWIRRASGRSSRFLPSHQTRKPRASSRLSGTFRPGLFLRPYALAVAVKIAVDTARATGVFALDAHLAVTAGMQVHRSGGTNIMRSAALDGSDVSEANDLDLAA